MTRPIRILYAAWVEPHTGTRRRHPVARLERTVNDDGQTVMQFRYVAGVYGAMENGFQLLAGMEDLSATYSVSDAFFFVRQRIMRPSRPDYGAWLASLGWPDGFDTVNDPFRVLIRSGGRNATDHLEFFAPIPLGQGRWRFEFFVRYVRGNPDLAPLLAAGQRPVEPLRIVAMPGNSYDPQSLAVHDANGQRVGLVPAYYTQALNAAARLPDTVEILALNPSPEASAHRLLVACEVDLPPDWDITHDTPELDSPLGSFSGIADHRPA